MADKRRMSLSFSMSQSEQKAAWDRLSAIRPGRRMDAVCRMINGYMEQRELLEEQQRQIEETRKRLNYKISRYEEAMKTGKLTWEENEGCHTNFITQQESCSEQDS